MSTGSNFAPVRLPRPGEDPQGLGAVRPVSQDGDNPTMGAKTDAAVTDATASASQIALFKGLVKILADAWNSGVHALRVIAGVSAQAPVAYRGPLTAADTMPEMGTITCTLLTGVGAVTAGTYTLAVSALNEYGHNLAAGGNTTVVTATTNLGIRLAFAAVAGATAYDIYLGTGAAPRCVGRITEAQRAAGCIITVAATASANATITGGGTANAVDVYVPASATANLSTAARLTNTAYLPVTGLKIPCDGYQFCDFYVQCTDVVDFATLAITFVPAFYDSVGDTWFFGEAYPMVVGGVVGLQNPLRQQFRIECRGNTGLVLLVARISGPGTTINSIKYQLS